MVKVTFEDELRIKVKHPEWKVRKGFPIHIEGFGGEVCLTVDYMTMQSGETSVLVYRSSVDSLIKVLLHEEIPTDKLEKTLQDLLELEIQ